MRLNAWIDGFGEGLRSFTRRVANDARGNVAMLFGLSLPVLILMTVGGVDIHRASTVRVNLQDALDAAALSAARSPYTAPADIQRVGLTSLRANLKAYPNITLREADTSFVLNSDAVVIASSKVDVKTLVANLFLPPYGQFMDDYLPVGAHSEVDRSSKNIEVGLVLDITGSMAGQRIIDLGDRCRAALRPGIRGADVQFLGNGRERHVLFLSLGSTRHCYALVTNSAGLGSPAEGLMRRYFFN